MWRELATMAIPGELALDLPAGKVKCWYVVEGDPRTYSVSGDDSTWNLNDLRATFTPLEGAAPLEANRSRGTVMSVKQRGTSKTRWLVLKVPKPGGRYLVRVAEGLGDKDARMVLKR